MFRRRFFENSNQKIFNHAFRWSSLNREEGNAELEVVRYALGSPFAVFLISLITLANQIHLSLSLLRHSLQSEHTD